MTRFDRRDVLRGSVGLLALGLAGCTTAPGERGDGTGDPTASPTASPTPSPTATPTPEPPGALTVSDGAVRVDLSAATGADVTVEGGQLVKYPEAAWELLVAYEGEPVTPDGSAPIRAGPELSGDGPAVFVAPVAVDGGFEYRAYANAAFVGVHDWRVVAGTGTVFDGAAAAGSRGAAFEEVYPGVYRDVVTADLVGGAAPADRLTVALSDATYDRLETDPPEDVTIVALLSREHFGSPSGPRAPQVAFAFEYDRDAEAVTVVHEGGDSVAAANLVVRVEGTPTGTQFADEYGTVQAGDRINVDVSDASSGASLRVVWESDEGDASETIGKTDLP